MSIGRTTEQTRWHDEAVAFARRELNDDILTRDQERTFWREGWTRCARFGIPGLPVPAEFGGKGLGLGETIAAMEGLGYGCPDNGLIIALNACLWTVTLPIVKFGSPEQKERWLPGLCDGTVVGANGASEPDAGSDIFSLKTSAKKRGDRWVLKGRKIWITAAPVADVFTVYATVDPARGLLGISVFLVPRDTPGFQVVRTIPKMGLHTVPMGELALENCELPPEALLGREGRGAEIFHSSMKWERGAILAATLGTMRRQLERCVAYARERIQFGQPISRFQAVSHRIAEMALRLETCRHLVYEIGRVEASGGDATLPAAMAKLHVSECSVANSLDAVRTFGAAGYVAETGIEKDLRDSVGSLIFSGTNDIQREIIARHLGLAAPRSRGKSSPDLTS